MILITDLLFLYSSEFHRPILVFNLILSLVINGFNSYLFEELKARVIKTGLILRLLENFLKRDRIHDFSVLLRTASNPVDIKRTGFTPHKGTLMGGVKVQKFGYQDNLQLNSPPALFILRQLRKTNYICRSPMKFLSQ